MLAFQDVEQLAALNDLKPLNTREVDVDLRIPRQFRHEVDRVISMLNPD